MQHSPVAPTIDEIRELSQSGELQDYWGGFDTAEELEACLRRDHIVKFRVTSINPEYCGDLFLIQSDQLSSDISVVRLIRGKNNQLVILRDVA